MATVWEEFGIAVAKAIGDKNWTLAAVADLAFGNPDRKGYVSQITKGRTKLNRATIQKLARALDLPPSITDKVYRAHLPPEDEITPEDQTAEAFLAEVEKSPPQGLSESLLIGLAHDFAYGAHGDVSSAYRGLRAALEAAERIAQRGAMPSNLDAQIKATFAEVARLNNDNQQAQAKALIARELARVTDEITERQQARAALIDSGFDQAYAMSDREAAAHYILARLALDPHPDPFEALHEEQDRWYEAGCDKGLAFDLQLSIALAEASLERAKTPYHWSRAQSALGKSLAVAGERGGDSAQLAKALNAMVEGARLWSKEETPLAWAAAQSDLGAILAQIGRVRGEPEFFIDAVEAFEEALAVIERSQEPWLWARTQNNLGNALQEVGSHYKSTAFLKKSVAAHRKAISERTWKANPEAWATSQSNLGVSLALIGDLTSDGSPMIEAIAAFESALAVRSLDQSPFDWAGTQLNIAILLWSFHRLAPDPDRLVVAKEKAHAARRVFLDAGVTAYLKKVDWLLSQIDTP